MRNPPERGEIWDVNFEPAIGAEIQKTRPAVVINIPESGRLPLRIVVPDTDWKSVFTRFFWFVHLSPSSENGLSKESGADCFQVKSLSINRFVSKLGEITKEELEDIVCAVAVCIGHHTEDDEADWHGRRTFRTGAAR